MKYIKECTLIDRAKRYFAKDGLALHKHNNVLIDYWDYSAFINICKESGILKVDEEVEG